MKTAAQKTNIIALDESALLLLDTLSTEPVKSAHLIGVSLPGVDEDPNSALTLAFLDYSDKALDQIVKEAPKDGILAFVFDNRYGFRYFSGLAMKEGGEAFEGLEDGKGHSLKEIKETLLNLGLNDVRVFFPFPDYRFPKIVYSEDLLPEKGGLRNLVGGVGKDRIVTFDEEKAFDASLDSGDFETFAPCYLVVAKKEGRK